MISRFERIVIALMFALLAAGITLVVAEAKAGVIEPQQAQAPDCATCHTEFQMTWQNGPHGTAGSDPVFLDEWNKQGKPGACLVCHTTGYDPATAQWKSDNVSCEACHGVAPADHPKSPMPVDRSPDLCGRCHSDTRFGWQDWQGSTHYQRGMSCATCHDPHSASLKIATPKDGTDASYSDASQLCINCHQEASMDFPYTNHHQQGVSCEDCHLEHLESTDRAAHTVPDHSFKASLQTCNKCHAEQMHKPADAVGTGVTLPVPETKPTAELTAEASKPTPVSPVGYAGLAGLVGLAAGMVLAPWLERFYRRVAKHGDDKNG